MGVGLRSQPPSDHAHFDFVPPAAVRSAIQVAQEHPIGFDRQEPWRRLVRVRRHGRGRLLRGLHLGDSRPLLPLPFGPLPFSLSAQRLAANAHTSQRLQHLSRVAERQQSAQVCFPAR